MVVQPKSEGMGWWPLEPLLGMLAHGVGLGGGGAAGSMMLQTLATRPAGMAEARRDGAKLVRDVVRRMAPEARRRGVVLAGFSQGAVMALDVALELACSDDAKDERVNVAAVVFLSGFPVDIPTWTERAKRTTSLNVLLAHGRRDPLVPLTAAQLTRDLLKEAGLANVRQVIHDGAHDVDVAAMNAVQDVLREWRVTPA